MKLIYPLLVLSVLFSPAVLAASDEVTVNFYTEPAQPHNFQPFFAGNQPAKITVEVRDAEGEPVKNVEIEINIKHVKGFASGKFLNTGFPYLEGKEVLGGKFFSRDGKLEFSYIFPIRGSYRVEVEVSPTDASSMVFEPFSEELNVRVKEWGYQIRNAVILVLLMLGFGIALGVVFGRASLRSRP